MIKGYQQIKREKKKQKSPLQKVRRFFNVSRLSLDEKVSEWKLERMRKRALKAETKISNNQETRNNLLMLKKQDTRNKKQTNLKIQYSIRRGGQTFGYWLLKIGYYLDTCNLFLVSLKKFFTNRIILRKVFASLTIIAVIVTAYFQNTPYASAATFYLDQTSWGGGESASESHGPVNNHTTIDTYAATPDAKIATGDNLTLATSSGEVTQTSNNDFGGGAFSQTTQNGTTGEEAGVRLALGVWTCGVNNITDSRNGQAYPSTLIGTQCWFAKNMNIGTRVNGSSNQSNNSTLEKYCYSDNDSNCDTYGGLYQWAEALQIPSSCNTSDCSGSINSPHQGICPTGWHIPKDDETTGSANEWYTLENYLKDSGQTCNVSRAGTWDCATAGTKLKAGGSSNFNALLAGDRNWNGTSFENIGSQTYFWAASDFHANYGRDRSINLSNATVYRNSLDGMGKTNGFSVRCVLNNGYTPTPPYYSSGTFTSSKIDALASPKEWTDVEWHTTQTANTSIVLKVKSYATEEASPDFDGCGDLPTITSANADSSASLSDYAAANPTCLNPNHRYIYYQATFANGGVTTDTPTLDDITFNYDYYAHGVTQTTNGTTNSGFNLSGADFDSDKVAISPDTAIGEDATLSIAQTATQTMTQTTESDTITTPTTPAPGGGFDNSGNVKSNTTISGTGEPASVVLDNDQAYSYLAVAHDASPYVTIYKRNGDTFTKLANPDILPPGNGYGTAFSPDNTYLCVTHANSPYITIYKRNGDTFTKLANPDILPANVGYYDPAFSLDGTYLSFGHANSPYITIYKRNGDTFTKLPDPDILPASDGSGVAFSPDGTYLSVGHNNSPYITIYKRNGDTFTKLPDPDILPTSRASESTFSLDGTYLSLSNVSSPYITIYKRNGDTFTKLANPDILPAGLSYDIAFSPDSIYLSVAHLTSPYATIYKRNGDTFTKLANPAILPVGISASGVSFSSDSTYLSVSHSASPYVTIYKRSGDTFTKLANPAILPSGGSSSNFFSSNLYLYYTSGTYTSYVNSTYSTPSWQTFNIIKSKVGGTGTNSIDIAVVAGGDSVPETFPTSGSPCYRTISTDANPTTDFDISSCAGSGQKLWYRATLTSGDSGVTSPTLGQFQATAKTYETAATYTSGIIDLGSDYTFSTVDFNGTIPLGTGMTVNVRAGDSTDLSGESWTGNLGDGGDISSLGRHRYVQYKINMTSDGNDTPLLTDVTINTQGDQTLTSPAYNTGDPDTQLADFTWNESILANTDIKFQIRTAPESGGAPDWNAGSGWCGPDDSTPGSCTSTTYFDTSGQALDDIQADGTNDRWFQYRVILNSTGTNTPTLNDVTLTYVRNNPPEINDELNHTVTAVQNADGTVTVDYEVRDTDTATGANPDDVRIDLQYCIAANLADCTETLEDEAETYWRSATTYTAGTYGEEVDVTDVYQPYQLVWNPKVDFPNEYFNGNFRVRVRADDYEAANQYAYGMDDTLTLDTTNPVSPQITVDRSVSTNQIKLNVIEDTHDQLQYAIDDKATFSITTGLADPTACFNGASTPAEYETYITANSLAWDAMDAFPKLANLSDDNDDSKKICVVFKDKYLNYSANSLNYAVTPRNPYSFEYYDVSNPDIEDYRLFLSWGSIADDPNTSDYDGGREKNITNDWVNGFDFYDIYRCTVASTEADCDPTVQYTTISAKTDNYLSETGLNDTTKYCYKFKVKDTNPDNTATGDFSAWSETQCIIPSEGGSSIGENISIHKDTIAVPDATRYATQVTINWNTYNATNPTKLLTASSKIGWKLPTASEYTYYELPGYAENHSVSIPGGQLLPNTTYDYMVYSETFWGTHDEVTTDADDNQLQFTTRDGPQILSYSVTNLGNTSAQINWTTNISSDSKIYYTEDPEVDLEDQDNGTCTGGFSTSHICNLVGLTPGAVYYYSMESIKENEANSYTVQSYDTEGNYLNFMTTTDSTPPDITPDINNPLIVTDTQAAISWETDESAKSWLLYDTESNDAFDFPESDFDPTDPLQNPYSDYIPNTAPDYSHTFVMDLDSLDPSTQHFYRMVAEDTSGNVTVYAEDDFTTLQTQIDHPELVESSVADPTDANEILVTDTEALIQYQTTTAPTHTTVKLCYATEQISDEDFTTCLTEDDGDAFHLVTSATTSIIHAFHLGSGAVGTDNPPMTQDETYYYRIQVTDSEAPGNSFTTSDSASINFTTLPDADLQHEPISGISDIEVLADFLTDTNAVITFNTDAASKCYAQVSAVNPRNPDTEIYANSITYWEDGYDEDKYNNSHSIHVTDLLFSTQHYFHLKCRDNLFDTGGSLEITSVENNFTTLEQQGADDDVTAPDITSVSVDTITGESATVKWTTDEKANSLVKYGITSGTYEGYGGDSTVNDAVANYETGHTVIINGLIPGTKYYYKVISYDAAGNFDESDEGSFTTKSASNLSSIKFSSIKLGEVTVTWKSSEKTTGVVEYGETEVYSDSKESKTQAAEHSINISGLKSNTEYHFRVSGQDSLNNLYSSGDYTYTPKSPPQITAVKTSSTTEHEATITFTTSAPTDALIVYTNTEDNSDTGSQGKPDLLTNHSITLKNLTSGVTYSYIITAKDYDGNASTYPATGQSSPSFTTGVDTAPPKIDQIRTDSALAQNDKVQTIISWITDELSDTALIYKEGQNSEPKEVKVSSNPTTNHIAVITIFKPGTVYFFKTKSTDLSGNSATSSDFALLTPKRKENIIQIIISNFEDIFGWAKF